MIKSPNRLTRFIVLSALLCLGTPVIGGCSPASSNPLIGSWKFASLTGTTTDCYSTAVFKDNVAIISYPEVPALPNNAYSTVTPARTVSVQILRYMPSATMVVAMSGGGGANAQHFPDDHENFNFVDKNHMWNESAWGKCYYERTN
jgi:hypothetical protein